MKTNPSRLIPMNNNAHQTHSQHYKNQSQQTHSKHYEMSMPIEPFSALRKPITVSFPQINNAHQTQSQYYAMAMPIGLIPSILKTY